MNQDSGRCVPGEDRGAFNALCICGHRKRDVQIFRDATFNELYWVHTPSLIKFKM